MLELDCIRVRVRVLVIMLCRLVVLWCLLASGYADDEDAVENHVIDLTSETFDDAIASNPVILVEFFAPWCGHCKRLAPEYETAATELSLDDPPVPLAKVDATEETSLADRFGINGYPTLKVFHQGNPYDYEGPRTAQGIVEYMRGEARPDWEPPKDLVIILTEDNFTQVVSEAELMLVEFYAPWCGHCKRLAPDYTKAARDLHKHNIPLAKIDATQETSLAEKYGVSGYPTLKVMRAGKDYDYTGPRERYGIVEYMLEQAKPASRQLNSKRELDNFLKYQRDPVFVTVSADSASDAFTTHDSLANAGRESPLTFAHSFSDEVASSLGLQQNSAAILTPQRLQSRYEPGVRVWEGGLDRESNVTALLASIMDTARPLVGIRSKSNVKWYEGSYPLLVVYTEVDLASKAIDILREQLLPIADDFSSQLTLAISDEQEFSDELSSLGLDDWGEDVAIAIWGSTREKYPMMQEYDTETLREFIQDYQSGSLKPHLRSQPRPHKQSGPVKVVVGSTFEEIVMDVKKHVLVEFYAPWCGHCKALEPKYKKLAKQFKEEDSVVIAKFDATANDAPPGFDFTGFPTIFFVQAGNNKISVYQGQREVKDMSKFIRKEANISKKSKKKSKEEL